MCSLHLKHNLREKAPFENTMRHFKTCSIFKISSKTPAPVMKIMQSTSGKGAFSVFEAISSADIAFKAQKAPFLIRFLTLI